MKIRRLFSADCNFSLATDPDNSGKTVLTGYALKWNTLSCDRGGYFVRLLPNSAQFAPNTYALFHHDWKAPQSSIDTGSLKLTCDNVGVKIEATLIADTQATRDLKELVAKKLVKGMSFAIADEPDAKALVEDGKNIIEISRFLCDEVTFCANPAFDDTSVEIKTDAPAENIATPADVADVATPNNGTIQPGQIADADPDDQANAEADYVNELNRLEAARLAAYDW